MKETFIAKDGNDYSNRLITAICLNADEFERIILKTEPNAEFDYSLDGLWVGTNDGELDFEDILAEYFGRRVSSVHLDDCDDIGVWVVFAREATT